MLNVAIEIMASLAGADQMTIMCVELATTVAFALRMRHATSKTLRTETGADLLCATVQAAMM